MEKCVQSLLPGGEEVEILIVDDGSKDRTAEIADRLEKEHSGIVRAIHQENGGHGEAVNTGIANATGKYRPRRRAGSPVLPPRSRGGRPSGCTCAGAFPPSPAIPCRPHRDGSPGWRPDCPPRRRAA